MPRIALGIEYDGGGYHGWQVQRDLPSVQVAVEAAIARFVALPGRIEVVVAGRTDAGVHARGQVAHCDVPVERTPASWVRGLNALLPDDIAVRWMAPVADRFHARFDAVRRDYRYLIWNHPLRSPLLRRHAAWCFRPLDEAAMHRAAQALVGEHDFSCFRSSECQAKSPVKTLYEVSVARRGEFVELHIAASAFLHHMVRNVVGSLVYVGSGRMPEAWIGELLVQRDRKLAAPTYAAEGLYFESVDYPAEAGLVEVMAADRARRAEPLAAASGLPHSHPAGPERPAASS
ncbi:tRNA pseudouridine(38-40) synthase TruA [Derxia lacustris]|uniref:tRNA pseudouridine(38-40) synthase TruA n=1 Tax=Derxia lacustris TaxID=764842 RepID=UPI000A17674A|nr:tRNA pseudouridine(38-40) synthase TruA [Derxia lacustris]